MKKKSFVIECAKEGGFHFYVLAGQQFERTFRTPNSDAWDLREMFENIKEGDRFRITKLILKGGK